MLARISTDPAELAVALGILFVAALHFAGVFGLARMGRPPSWVAMVAGAVISWGAALAMASSVLLGEQGWLAEQIYTGFEVWELMYVLFCVGSVVFTAGFRQHCAHAAELLRKAAALESRAAELAAELAKLGDFRKAS